MYTNKTSINKKKEIVNSENDRRNNTNTIPMRTYSIMNEIITKGLLGRPYSYNLQVKICRPEESSF